MVKRSYITVKCSGVIAGIGGALGTFPGIRGTKEKTIGEGVSLAHDTLDLDVGPDSDSDLELEESSNSLLLISPSLTEILK